MLALVPNLKLRSAERGDLRSRQRGGDGPEGGKSLASLQTCTPPDCEKRLTVEDELVDEST
jgi:hypothetical protein